ncbi:MAG: hypothetical protein ACE15E_22150 [Acidobacteriota bacterium]
MRSDSKDLSGKIDPLTMEILSLVYDAAKRLGVDFFVVGATARDLILHYVYGLQLKRATQDIDLGVEVGDWGAFSGLRKALLETGQFAPSQ